MLVHHQTPKLDDYHLSAVYSCFCNIFAAIIHYTQYNLRVWYKCKEWRRGKWEEIKVDATLEISERKMRAVTGKDGFTRCTFI
jgi:hypothetical protein